MSRAGPILYGDPVERSHPLNAGLVAWWLPLPGRGAGGTLWDLVGRYPAVFANGAAINSVDAFGRFPAASFDGLNDQADATTPATANPLSMYGWFKTSEIANTQRVFCIDNESAGTPHVLASVMLNINGSGTPSSGAISSQVYSGVGSTTGGSGANGLTQSSVGFTSGQWIWVGVVQPDSSTQRVYVNGVRTASNTWTYSPSGITKLRFANNAFDGTQPFAGQLTDWRFHSVALSDEQMSQQYLQSRAGHPDTLRRLRSFVMIGNPAGLGPGVVANFSLFPKPKLAVVIA